MIFEGVNFSESAACRMTAEEFERIHIGVFWQDRDEETRKKMLAKAYSLMVKPKVKKQ